MPRKIVAVMALMGALTVMWFELRDPQRSSESWMWIGLAALIVVLAGLEFFSWGESSR
jgi:hypothetical protein